MWRRTRSSLRKAFAALMFLCAASLTAFTGGKKWWFKADQELRGVRAMLLFKGWLVLLSLSAYSHQEFGVLWKTLSPFQTTPLKPDLFSFYFFIFLMAQAEWDPAHGPALSNSEHVPCSSQSLRPLHQLLLGLAASGKALLLSWRLCPACREFRFTNQWVGSSCLPGEGWGNDGKRIRERHKPLSIALPLS